MFKGSASEHFWSVLHSNWMKESQSIKPNDNKTDYFLSNYHFMNPTVKTFHV